MKGKEDRLVMKKGNILYRIVPLVLVAGMLLSGCSRNQEDMKVVLTTGFGKNEVFRIEETSCSREEIMVYLTNIQNHYETVYGERIWETNIDGVSLEENVKETALAKMAQIKAMTLLAEKHNVSLTEEEEGIVKEAAIEYYTSLNDAEKQMMGVTEDTIRSLYSEFATANKLYHYLIKDINPEISDDEARTITVEHILIKTYNLDENGEKAEYSKHAKEQAYRTACDVAKRAKAGEDFHQLADQYNEDDAMTYSFGKGEMEPGFEEASFNLGTDEISDVVETQFGYHVIKCTSTFNQEVTEENKKKIVEERKKEVFGEEYETFVSSLVKHMNKELWNEITFIHDENVTTSDFFEIYDKHFEE